MRTDRTDLLVGSIALSTLLIIVVVGAWLTPAFRAREYAVYADFSEISGVGERAPVYLRGYEIGRVTEIRPVIASNGGMLFRIRMDVRRYIQQREPLVLPAGTTAVLQPPPVLGSATIELRLPDPPLHGELEEGAVIPGIMEVPLARKASELGGSLVFDVSTTLTAMRSLMDSLAVSTALVNRVLAQSGQAVPGVLAGVDSQFLLLRQFTGELRAQIATLAPALTTSVDSMNVLLGNSRALVAHADSTLTTAQPLLNTIMANLESTTLVLDHVTRQLARSPVRIFTGVAVPPLDSLRRTVRQ